MCKQPILSNKLGPLCGKCLEQSSHKAMLEYQRLMLPAVLDGRGEYRLARADGLVHLELFGDRNHSYCGASLAKVTKRFRSSHAALAQEKICIVCRNRLNELLEKTDPPAPTAVREAFDSVASLFDEQKEPA
jgi:hypothetical protein